VCLGLLFGLLGYGQNRQLLYDFREIPQSNLVNPGIAIPHDWYVGVPLLSNIAINAGSNGVSVYDIFAEDGIDINDKIREKMVFGMGIKDELSGRFHIDLINFGFKSKKDPSLFFSGGMYLDGDAIGYWPADWALLGFEGNADYIGKRFDLDHVKTRGEFTNVFHFGVNKQWKPNLIVGARAKIYSGIFNFSSTNNSGYFVTTEGERNILASTLVADAIIRSSGIDELLDDANEDQIGSILTKRALLGGNLGFGVDLGFTYYLDQQTTFTASLLDLGFMYNNTNVKSFSLKGSSTVEGVEIILPDALQDPDADFWQDLIDRVEEEIPFEENSSGYVTFRPTILNASIRRDWGQIGDRVASCDCDWRTNGGGDTKTMYANAVGAHVYAINRPRGPQTAWTLFYQRNITTGFSLKATYTADKFTYTNVGVGVSLKLGPVQAYILADNLLAYRNYADTNYASLQLGVNVLSWAK
jgi:hypothetical protein